MPLCLQGLCKRQECKECLLHCFSPSTTTSIRAPSSPTITACRAPASSTQLFIFMLPPRILLQCGWSKTGGPLFFLLLFFFSSDSLYSSEQHCHQPSLIWWLSQYGRLRLPVSAEPRDCRQHRGSAAGRWRLQHGHWWQSIGKLTWESGIIRSSIAPTHPQASIPPTSRVDLHSDAFLPPSMECASNPLYLQCTLFCMALWHKYTLLSILFSWVSLR